MRPTVIEGLHGLGDNIHQRVIVRHFLEQGFEVWLETPWPCIYHDMVGECLHLIDSHSRLRTQAKNATRERGKYSRPPPAGFVRHRVTYSPADVRKHGSVLAAMLASSRIMPSNWDLTLPVPVAWHAKAAALLAFHRTTKPVLIVRPLVERTEWSGCRARNPDHTAYALIYQSLRDQFFVVSVADTELRREWLAAQPLRYDVAFHKGELDIETLIAMFARAALIYTSPGFAVPLAQAVSTPVICVFGGYENSRSFSAVPSAYLGIDPIKPCDNFSHAVVWDKTIDLPRAYSNVRRFIDERVIVRSAESLNSAQRQ